MIVEIRKLAEAELAEAAAWYDLQLSGLGAQFLDQFEMDVKSIADAPTRWPAYHAGARRYVMNRFPFVIYFDIRRETVRVLRVVHTSREPGEVQKSLE